ncbi:hypothetical protein PR048_010938 [Dryococelus australis]|uniref:Uncharacterized protein n=1 Tax=Dryococelus australis TaxID=614101 RepID=A0ABQ9HK90_9NEOP|nr:hypothetical protein PR048_010938 [Dryococelus australis]
MKGRGKREIYEKTRGPSTSYGTAPTYKNPGVTRPGIEPGLPWGLVQGLRPVADRTLRAAQSWPGRGRSNVMRYPSLAIGGTLRHWRDVARGGDAAARRISSHSDAHVEWERSRRRRRVCLIGLPAELDSQPTPSHDPCLSQSTACYLAIRKAAINEEESLRG